MAGKRTGKGMGMQIGKQVALGLALVIASAIHAADRDTVFGQWASDGSIIEIAETDNGLSAIVIALNEPTYQEAEDFGPVGAVRRDDLNPEPKLQARHILGIDLLSEYEYDGKWSGKIYDPESGNTYSSNMQVGRDGRLKMRGYIGVPMFGRTALFEPVSSCKPYIVMMIELAKLSSSDCNGG